MSWLDDLTPAERQYWDSKPAPERDWWERNTDEGVRAESLRIEMEGMKAYREFKKLPLPRQLEFLEESNREAHAAKERLRSRGRIPADRDKCIEVPELNEAQSSGGRNDSPDVGIAAVQGMRKAMQIDARWSCDNERGFTWWGHRLAQRVWSEPARVDSGLAVFRLHAQTEVVRSASQEPAGLELINSLNALCLTSAFVLDPISGVVSLRASMWVHAETVVWVSRLFSFVATLQAADAHAQAEAVAKFLGGEVAVSAHPRSGKRPFADDMLMLRDELVGPTGERPSAWSGEEMKVFAELGEELPAVVLATGSEDGIALEYPYLESTALLNVEARARHPEVGNGMFMRLSLPEYIDDREGPTCANSMNRRELDAATHSHFLGSWVARDGKLHFVTFVPNAGKIVRGDVHNLLLSAALRAQWVAEDLRGDDWSASGRIEEVRKRKLDALRDFSKRSRMRN